MLLAGFVAIALTLAAGSPLAIDEPLMWQVRSLTSAGLDQLSWWLARLGYGYGVIPFQAVLAIVLLVRSRTRDATFVASAFLGSALLNTLLKLSFERARPTLWQTLENHLSYSFPSGHAMATGTFVVVVTALVWHTRWRWAGMVSAAGFALLVGVFRVYEGVHFPSDVLAGWCAGAAWALLMHLLVSRMSGSPDVRAGD